MDAIDGLQRCLDLNQTHLAANELLQDLLQLEEIIDSLVRPMINCELVHASHSTQNTNESRNIDIRPLVFGSDIHIAREQGPSCPPAHSIMEEVGEEIEEICSENEEEGE
jgi:hypothetical protein